MLKDKIIVIIGGTSGIGLSAAKAFLNNGAKVVTVGLDEASCRHAAAEMPFEKGAIVLQKDARDASTAVEAISTAINTFGGFNGLYHVAGGSGRKWGDAPLHALTLEGWHKTLDLNLTSVMLSNQAAVKAFLKLKQGGSILNLGSVLGDSPSPHYFSTHAYAAAKAAIAGFTKSIAAYYAKDNIRVNVLAPALVETPMSARASEDESIQHFIKTKQPLDSGRNGQPSDLVGAALYFMSDFAAFTTGQVLYVDGGWHISEGQY